MAYYKVKGVNGDAFVSICFGDVLSDNGSIVVPVNSCFDTSMDANMISAECIQGQFQNKYFLNNQHSLDTLLEEALKRNDEFEKIERSSPMKNKRYPLGTIAKINLSQANVRKRFYLLAVVDKNESFMSVNTFPDTYEKMLRNFWQQMLKYGHNESRLAISVLGIGRAGYGIDVETALVYMVCSYIEAIKESNVVNNLAIYINWNTVEKKKINVKKIKKHIEAICKYKNSCL